MSALRSLPVPYKIADRHFIGAPDAAVADVGEPLDLGQDFGQPAKFRSGQEPIGVGSWGPVEGRAWLILLLKNLSSILNSGRAGRRQVWRLRPHGNRPTLFRSITQLIAKGKNPFPVVLHANDEPALLHRLVVQRLGEGADFGVGQP